MSAIVDGNCLTHYGLLTPYDASGFDQHHIDGLVHDLNIYNASAMQIL